MKSMRTVTDLSEEPAHFAFVEKKSEFISDACHITTLEEAIDFVESIRLKHPKARHVAYAAVCGDNNGRLCERMSDDGEPSGTAGKPILDVVRVSNLTDTVVTVTRYFGGILLGSGGLMRAYSRAAAGAIQSSKMADIVECNCFSCKVEYTQLRMFKNLLLKHNAEIMDEEYGISVDLKVCVPFEESDRFLESVKNTFSAIVIPKSCGVYSRIS
ncbi:IMPACT family protein [Gardnerella vaginalis]|uniref:IMPACT family protein n=1 Tax=Gardnerella vaginalis TaxID=2702 RepID=UPI0039F01E27